MPLAIDIEESVRKKNTLRRNSHKPTMSHAPPAKRPRTDYTSAPLTMNPYLAARNAQIPRSTSSINAPFQSVPPMQHGSSVLPSIEPGSNAYYPAERPAPQPSSSKRRQEVIDLTDDADPPAEWRNPSPFSQPHLPYDMSDPSYITAKLDHLERNGIITPAPPPPGLSTGRGACSARPTDNWSHTAQPGSKISDEIRSSKFHGTMSESLSPTDSDSWARSSPSVYPEIEDEQAALDVADRLANEFKSTYGPNGTSGRPFPAADSTAPWGLLDDLVDEDMPSTPPLTLETLESEVKIWSAAQKLDREMLVTLVCSAAKRHVDIHDLLMFHARLADHDVAGLNDLFLGKTPSAASQGPGCWPGAAGSSRSADSSLPAGPPRPADPIRPTNATEPGNATGPANATRPANATQSSNSSRPGYTTHSATGSLAGLAGLLQKIGDDFANRPVPPIRQRPKIRERPVCTPPAGEPRIINFDYLAAKTWDLVNKKHIRKSCTKQRWDLPRPTAQEACGYMKQIADTCGESAHPETRLNGLWGLYWIGAAVRCSEGYQICSSVRKEFYSPDLYEPSLRRVITAMSHEERRKVVEDTSEPDGLWTRLLDLEEKARGYCIFSELSGVLDLLRKPNLNGQEDGLGEKDCEEQQAC